MDHAVIVPQTQYTEHYRLIQSHNKKPLLIIKEQTIKTPYLSVQAITFHTEKQRLYNQATVSIISTLQALLFPQPPAVCIEQSKLPSSTNIPCLFMGRPVIKIIPQYMNKDTFNKGCDSIYTLIFSALSIFCVVKSMLHWR